MPLKFLREEPNNIHSLGGLMYSQAIRVNELPGTKPILLNLHTIKFRGILIQIYFKTFNALVLFV